MIKLIATDLDGTLVDRQGHIAAEDIAALRRAREMGALVVVATGRMPSTLELYLERLEVGENDPVVGGQGAVIARRNGEALHVLTIPRHIALAGAAIVQAHDAVPVFYTLHGALMPRVAFSPAEDAFWLGDSLRYDPEALAHLDDDLVKLLAVQPDKSRAPALLDALQEELGDRAEVVRSHHWFIEAVHKRATKGEAIAWLAAQQGIARDEVLAIGDAGNDVSMLRWAGVSAAPADATPDARDAASWVGPRQSEHIVAAAIKRYLP